MNILIVNIDSKLPNIALQKIERYHLSQGDAVYHDLPIFKSIADKIYVSCIFSFNKHLLTDWIDEPKAMIGGSGYDIQSKLDPEIEKIDLHINYGFTSRGCIRKCPFCIVPKKEGLIHKVGDLYNLWDGKSRKVTLIDNNILALPDHFEEICLQAQKHKITIDHNQGLDHRLLTPEICQLLKKTSHKDYVFAFDTLDEYDSVERAIKMLDSAGIRFNRWFVLCGFNTTFQEDYDRLVFLKNLKQRVFVMRYETVRKDHNYARLAAWANMRQFFNTFSFEEFCKIKDNPGKKFTFER